MTTNLLEILVKMPASSLLLLQNSTQLLNITDFLNIFYFISFFSLILYLIRFKTNNKCHFLNNGDTGILN